MAFPFKNKKKIGPAKDKIEKKFPDNKFPFKKGKKFVKK